MYYDVINVMLLSDDVTLQFVLYSVVSKHLLLALSVLCLYWRINNGSIANIMISQRGFKDRTCNRWKINGENSFTTGILWNCGGVAGINLLEWKNWWNLL